MAIQNQLFICNKNSKGSWGETAHLLLDGAHFPLAFTHNQGQKIKYTVYLTKKML